MQEPNNRNPENTMPLDPFAAAEAPVQSAETTYPVEADGEIHELTLDELIEAAAQGLSRHNAYVRRNRAANALLLDYDLSINRSYIKKISHCLAAVPGATMADIRSVCSHPHALPQCSAFISAHGFTAIEAANTAIAAQNVRDKGDVSLAAICSREAAERYGLSILAEGINDIKHNETRFIAVSRTPTCLPEDNRIEIAFHIPNAAGTLITVLDIIAHYGIDMTEIHSRPLKDSPWCYVFYVDFTGNINDHAVRSLLYQLHEELPYIKVLGSYKVD